MDKTKSFFKVFTVSLVLCVFLGTTVYASDESVCIEDEQVIEGTDSFSDDPVEVPELITENEDTLDGAVNERDYPHDASPIYLMMGEGYHFDSFEDPRYDNDFQGKRTQTPVFSKKGILRYFKSVDNGVLYFHFRAVKPGTTDLYFTVKHKDGSYNTEPFTFIVVKPYLSKTKFEVSSLSTQINMVDYIDGIDLSSFPRAVYAEWKSSKPSVAEIDSNGIVTMKGAGTTKITGKIFTEYDGKATVSATVTVKTPKMNKTSVSMVPGQKVKITLGNMPKGVTVDRWELPSWGYKVRDDVYHDGVEKKENGNSCEVTAFMECGGQLKAIVGSDTYICDIEVKAPKIKKTEMTLKKGRSGKISVGGTKFKPNVFSYTSSDTDVATVDANGKVTAVSSGVAYIDVYLYQTKACMRSELPEGGRVKITVP